MTIKIFQKGFNFSQDGPGNRLVYHLQGCNMKCPWCSNPEGININGSLMVNNEILIDSVCPRGAIHDKDLNRDICNKCTSRDCIKNNVNSCIWFSNKEYELDLILDEVKRSSALFFGGGGVTLTGGEVTIQFEAVKELLNKFKKAKINTAIETNGTHQNLQELFPLIDHLIIDFKHYDNHKLYGATGIGNKVIKDNLIKAFKVHKNLLVRIPIIKGFNDTKEDIHNFSIFFRKFNTLNTTFEFLPYHEYGKIKWEQCGMPYTIENGTINSKVLELYIKEFTQNNLKVVHT